MPVPTADDVARAVVAACRETGADPIALMEGQSGSSDYSIARARAYAAFALDELFEIGPAKIKRMLHSATDQSTLRFQRSKGVLRWWDDGALGRVKAAIRAEETPVRKVAFTDAVPLLPGAERIRALVPVESRRVITRIAAKPTDQCQDVTAELMGDPPRERSALAERLHE